MSEYARTPENKPRTLDAKPRISRQVPVDVLLQCHNVCTRPDMPGEEKTSFPGRIGEKNMQFKSVDKKSENSEKYHGRGVIQQMVLPLWRKEKDKADFVKQANIQSEELGHGQVIRMDNLFRNKNLSGIGEYEDLHIIGHGNSQSVVGISPQALAHLVVNELKLPAQYKGRIYLETCQSGKNPTSLEGSYSARFIAELNRLRGEGCPPLSAVGFDGTLVLDNAMPGKCMFRILKKNISIDEFREYATTYVQICGGMIQEFLDKLREADLLDYIEEEEVRDLFFLMYNNRISPYAEPQGGELTKLYLPSGEYQGLPDEEPDILKIMDGIKTKAAAKKQDIESIPVQVLDLGDLHLELS